jgi:hypothetical protein
MIRKFSQAWIDAQAETDEGVVGAVKNLIQQTMAEIYPPKSCNKSSLPSRLRGITQP